MLDYCYLPTQVILYIVSSFLFWRSLRSSTLWMNILKAKNYLSKSTNSIFNFMNLIHHLLHSQLKRVGGTTHSYREKSIPHRSIPYGLSKLTRRLTRYFDLIIFAQWIAKSLVHHAVCFFTSQAFITRVTKKKNEMLFSRLPSIKWGGGGTLGHAWRHAREMYLAVILCVYARIKDLQSGEGAL